MSAADQTRDLVTRLRRHYIKPGPFAGGVFVPECGWNGGGPSRCDALFCGFTGSSGRLLIGHEVKVSRADWRRELDKPGKADPWADQCHAWYVVAPSTSIVPASEVPDGWGLLIPNARSSSRMDVIVKARVHHDRQPSWDATRSLLARLDTLQQTELAEQAQRIRQETEKAANQWAEQRVEQLLQTKTAPDQHQRLVKTWEDVLGRKLSPHAYPGDGEISPHDLRDLLTLIGPVRELRNAARALTGRFRSTADIRRACDQLDQAVASIEGIAS